MEDTSKKVEIIELDARLDMALDPLGMLGSDMWGGDYCGNDCTNGACGNDCGKDCRNC